MKRPDTYNRWWFAAAVIGAAGVGVAVRLAGAGDRTLFWDEAYHVRLALEPSLGAVLGAVLANPPSDPLFALVLYGWTAMAGTSDFAVRLPSIAFAAVTVVATAWLALELTASRRVVLLAAVLVAVAPYAVEYGQEASLYSLAAMTTTLALAAGWRWRASGSRRDAAWAIALAIVAIYSHYVVAAVLAIAGALSLARLAGPRAIGFRQVAIAASIVLIAWLPWLVPMLISWGDADVPRTALSHSATVAELLGALSQYASGTGALLEGVRLLQLLGVAAAGALLLRGWIVGGAAELGGLRVIVLTAGVLFVGPWMVSAVSGRWLFVPHMMLFVLPALAVVIADGAVLRPQPTGASRSSTLLGRASVVAIVALIVAQLGGLLVNATDPPHGADGSRDLAVTLASRAAPGDPVLITPNEQQLIFERYWNGQLHGVPRDIDLRVLYGREDARRDLDARIARFDEIAGSAERAWLVYTAAREADRLFVAWLGANRAVTTVAEFPFGRLLEIRRIDARGPLGQ